MRPIKQAIQVGLSSLTYTLIHTTLIGTWRPPAKNADVATSTASSRGSCNVKIYRDLRDEKPKYIRYVRVVSWCVVSDQGRPGQPFQLLYLATCCEYVYTDTEIERRHLIDIHHQPHRSIAEGPGLCDVDWARLETTTHKGQLSCSPR